MMGWITAALASSLVTWSSMPRVTRYDGSLVQVTRVLSADLTCCDSVEQWMHHPNRGGGCLVTIISCLPAVSSAKGEGKDSNEIGEEMAKRKFVVKLYELTYKCN